MKNGIKKVLNFLFIPSMDGMGMGCLTQTIFYVVIIIVIISFLSGKHL